MKKAAMQRPGDHALLMRPSPIVRPLLQARWALLPVALLPLAAIGNPTGGSVVAGQASIQGGAGLTTIQQQSASAVINWQQFGIGSGETVNFVQPSASAAILNRVIGGDASAIFGNLTSNGRVFLINPQGVMFGAGARVDVGGLVASTLDVRNEDFMAGRYVLAGGSNPAAVSNDGVITARDGGFVVLAGGDVQNGGLIQTRLGDVVLASGAGLTLDMNDTGLISYRIDAAALSDVAGVTNTGSLMADGGRVFMAAKVARELASTAVNNSGTVRATRIGEQDGVIVLEALGGNTENSGTLTATSETGSGGTIRVLGDQDVLVNGGTLDASGATGGGVIRIGGGWQGGEGLTTAARTYLAPTATVRADALDEGKGGNIVLWSDQNTVVAGLVSAVGAGSGDGGDVETSSHGGLAIDNAPRISGGALGSGGSWLIDPYNLTIVAGGGGGLTGVSQTSSTFTSTGDDATIQVGVITDALAGGGNVTVQTVNGGGDQAGDLVLNADVNLDFSNTGNSTLNLIAFNDIQLNGNVFGSGSSGNPSSLTLNLNAGAAIGFNGSMLNTNGGAITALAGGNIDVNNAISTSGGAFTATSSGGTITFGNAVNTGTGNLSATASTGDIVVNSDIGSGNLALTASGSNGQINFDYLDNTLLVSSSGAIDLAASNGIANRDLSPGGDEGGVRFLAGSGFTATGTSGAIALDHADIDAVSAIDIEHLGGGVDIGNLTIGSASTAGNIRIVAGGGNIHIGNIRSNFFTGNVFLGTASAVMGDLTLQAAGKVSADFLLQGGNLQAGSIDISSSGFGNQDGDGIDFRSDDGNIIAASLTATSGGIRISDIETLENFGQVDLTASSGSIDLASDGDILIGSLTAGGPVTIGGFTVNPDSDDAPRSASVTTGAITTTSSDAGNDGNANADIRIAARNGITIFGDVTTSAITTLTSVADGQASAIFDASTLDGAIVVDGSISTQAYVGYNSDGNLAGVFSGNATAAADITLSAVGAEGSSVNTRALSSDARAINDSDSGLALVNADIRLNNSGGSIGVTRAIEQDDSTVISAVGLATNQTGAARADANVTVTAGLGGSISASHDESDSLVGDDIFALGLATAAGAGIYSSSVTLFADGDIVAGNIVASGSNIGLTSNFSSVDIVSVSGGSANPLDSNTPVLGDLSLAAYSGYLAVRMLDDTVANGTPVLWSTTGNIAITTNSGFNYRNLDLSAGGNITVSTAGTLGLGNLTSQQSGINLQADASLDSVLDGFAITACEADCEVGTALLPSAGNPVDLTTGDLVANNGDLGVFNTSGGNIAVGSIGGENLGLVDIQGFGLLRINEGVATTVTAQRINLLAGADDPNSQLLAIDAGLLDLVTTGGSVTVNAGFTERFVDQNGDPATFTTPGSIVLGSITTNVNAADGTGEAFVVVNSAGGDVTVGDIRTGSIGSSIVTNYEDSSGNFYDIGGGDVRIGTDGTLSTGAINTSAAGAGSSLASVFLQAGGDLTVVGSIGTTATTTEGQPSAEPDAADASIFAFSEVGGITVTGDIQTVAVVGDESTPSANPALADASVFIANGDTSSRPVAIQTEGISTLAMAYGTTLNAGEGTPPVAAAYADIQIWTEYLEFETPGAYGGSITAGGSSGIISNVALTAGGVGDANITAFATGGGITLNGPVQTSASGYIDLLTRDADVQSAGDITLNGALGSAVLAPLSVRVESGAALRFADIHGGTVTLSSTGDMTSTAADGHLAVTSLTTDPSSLEDDSLTGNITIQAASFDGNVFTAQTIRGNDITLDAARGLITSGFFDATLLDTDGVPTGGLGNLAVRSGDGTASLSLSSLSEGTIEFRDAADEYLGGISFNTGNLMVQAQDFAITSDVTLGGSLSLTSTVGGIAALALNAGSNLSLASAQGLSASSLTAGGALSATATNGDLVVDDLATDASGDGVVTGGSVVLETGSFGNIGAGAVTATTGNVRIDAQIDNSNTAASDVSLGSVTSTLGSVSINSGAFNTSTRIGDITAVGDVNVDDCFIGCDSHILTEIGSITSSGTISIGTLFSAHSVTVGSINATSGNASSATLQGGAGLTVRTLDNVAGLASLSAGTALLSLDSATAGSLSLTAGSVIAETAGGAISLITQGSDLSVDAASLTANGLTLQSAGNLTLNNSALDAGAALATLQADAGTVFLNNTVTAGSLSVTGQSISGNSSITVPGALSLIATAGDVTLASASADTVTVSATGNVQGNGTALSLASVGNLSVTATSIISTGSLGLTTTGGNIVLGSTDIVAGSTAAIDSAGSIAAGDITAVDGITAYSSSGGTILLGNLQTTGPIGSILVGERSLLDGATDAGAVSVGLLTTAGSAQIASQGGNVSVQGFGSTPLAAQADLIASNGTLTLGNAANAPGILNLTGSNGIVFTTPLSATTFANTALGLTVGGSTALTLGDLNTRSFSLTTGNGTVTLGNIAATQTLGLSGNGNITAASLAGDGGVTLQAGSLDAGSVGSSAGSVAGTIAGAMTVDTLTAATGINVASTTDALTINTLARTTTGDLALSGATLEAATVDATNGSTTLNGGTIRVDSVSGNGVAINASTLLTTRGSGVLTIAATGTPGITLNTPSVQAADVVLGATAGGIQLGSANLSSTGDARLTSLGAISGTGTITAAELLNIDSTNGSINIGVLSGDTVQVNAASGNVTVAGLASPVGSTLAELHARAGTLSLGSISSAPATLLLEGNTGIVLGTPLSPTALSATDLSLVVGGNASLNAGNLDTRNFTLTAGTGPVTLGNVTALQMLSLDADGNVTAGSLSGGSGVSLRAASLTVANAISSSAGGIVGNIMGMASANTLSAATGIDMASASGLLRITSSATTTAGNIALGGSTLDVGDLTASTGNITLNSSSAIIGRLRGNGVILNTASGLTGRSGTGIDITALGAPGISGAASLISGNTVSLVSAGSIQLGNSAIRGNTGAVVLDSTGAVMAGTIEGVGKVTVNTRNAGNISLSTVTATGSAGNVLIGERSTGGNIDAGIITVGVITGAGQLTVASEGGNVTVGGIGGTPRATRADLSSSGTLTLGTLTNAPGTLNLTGLNGLVLGSALAGNLTATNLSLITQSGSLLSLGNLSVGALNVQTGNGGASLGTVTSASTVTLGGNGAYTASGPLTAASLITLGGTSFSGGAVISTAGGITGSFNGLGSFGAVQAAQDVTLSSTANRLSFGGTVVSTGGDIALLAAQDVSLLAGATANAGAITLTGTTGGVSTGGDLVAQDDLNISSTSGRINLPGQTRSTAGNVRVSTGSVNTGVVLDPQGTPLQVGLFVNDGRAANLFQVTSSGNIALNTIEAGTVVVNTTGSLSSNSAINLSSTAGDLSVTASSIQAPTLTLDSAAALIRSAAINVTGLTTLVADSGTLNLANISTNSLDATAQSLISTGAIVLPGALSLTATQGNIITGALTAASITESATTGIRNGAVVATSGNVTATTGNALATGRISAVTGATLTTTSGALTINGPLTVSNGNALLTATGNVLLGGSGTASGAFTVTSDNDIVGNSSAGLNITAGSVSLDAEGNITSASAPLSLTSTVGNLTVSADSITGPNVSLDAETTLIRTGLINTTGLANIAATVGTVSLDGITAGSLLARAPSISASNAITLTGFIDLLASNGALTVADLAAGGPITLIASTGNVTVGSITGSSASLVSGAGRDVTVTGLGNVTGLLSINSGRNIFAHDLRGGSLALNATGNLSDPGHVYLTATSLTGTVSGNIENLNAPDVRLDVAGDVTLDVNGSINTGAAGSIRITSVQAITDLDPLNTGTLTITAPSVVFSAGTVVASTLATITASDGGINLDGFKGGALVANATNGDIEFNNASTSGALTARAVNGNIYGSYNGGIVTLDADRNIDANVTADGLARLTARTGFVGVDTLTAGSILLSAATDIQGSDTNSVVLRSTSGNIGITAPVINAGLVDISSAGAINLGGTNINAGTATGNVVLNAATGAAAFNQITTRDLSVTAATINSTATLVIAGDLSLQTTAGDLTTGAVTTGGDLHLSSAGRIETAALRGGNVTVISGDTGGITTSSITADGDITLRGGGISAGSLVSTGLASESGGTLDLVSFGDIDVGTLRGNTASVLSYGGDVRVASADLSGMGSLTALAGSVATDSLTAGAIAISGSQLRNYTLASGEAGYGGDISLTSTVGGITVSAPVVGDGAVTLDSATGIAVTGINATRDVSLAARQGDITATGSYRTIGNIQMLAETGGIRLDNSSIEGNLSYLAADTITASESVSINVAALSAAGRILDFSGADIVVGQGEAPMSSDFGLIAALGQQGFILPSSLIPNASFDATEALALASVSGTAHYIVLRAPVASIPNLGSISSTAGDLFLQYAPTDNAADFTFDLAQLSFASSAATFAFGSSDYMGAIFITDPSTGIAQTPDKALTADGNNTNYITLSSGTTFGAETLQTATTGQVVVLGPATPVTPPAPPPPTPEPPVPTPPAPTPPSPTPVPTPVPVPDPVAGIEDQNLVLLGDQLIPAEKKRLFTELSEAQLFLPDELLVTRDSVEQASQQCDAIQ
ncbi:MAG: filamentous hemagglutinin N-terminal domain-containing protein [Stagnimonas sp.]|nr:filamentous hemagglutinin N-terminal domain-containing protein [Stagnimonas sp.]